MESFNSLSKQSSRFTGHPACFWGAVLLVVAWLAMGPMFGFSDTWQLVINTGTTIITFLMVFLIQGTQNRDTEAIQLKLDELIRATRNARNAMMDLEEMDEEALEALRAHYETMAQAARDHGQSRRRQRGGDDAREPSKPHRP